MYHRSMFVKKVIVVLIVTFVLSLSVASDPPETPKPLTIDKIMMGQKFVGSWPGRVRWSENSKQIYFEWNPEDALDDSLYTIFKSGGPARKVTLEERKAMGPGRGGDYDKAQRKKVYAKDGDIFILDIPTGKTRQITNTLDRESNPQFTHDEKKITFTKSNNLYLWNMITGETVQLTNFKDERGGRGGQKGPKTQQEKWVKKEESRLIKYIEQEAEKDELSKKEREDLAPNRPKMIPLNGKRVQGIALSPDERFITFQLSRRARDAKRTIIPNYVTETGFTEDIPARSKVGSPQGSSEFGIYDTKNDTVLFLSTGQIPGIFEMPEYLKEYKKDVPKKKEGEEEKATPSKGEKKKAPKRKPREVMFMGLTWSDDGSKAVMSILSMDHKDRWIVQLHPDSAKVTLLDRQHDEAWISGPGIMSWRSGASLGWMPDNRRIWFQSEVSGYSHLYLLDTLTGEKRALTSGQFEVSGLRMSRNKKHWYFTTNEVHPGVRHFYRMPIEGGKRTQITSMEGRNDVSLSPDEKTLAIRFSTGNRPWEIYFMPNKPGAKGRKVTQSTKQGFDAYPWRMPEVLTFEARDGAQVYARLYRPENPTPNGPAVVFVHGAGYLQNAHKWWSSYYREYMFHNFLVDNGYTVLDIDYRASSGYGRDWRTGIYRFMGGKDLTDHVDGADFLVQNYDVDPKRIGIYGGSYGGFITLMAMFTTPDVFAAGAALRPVTDWAHYNHWYTSNILNVPYADSTAYIRSSPIYHAEGLKGALLICHGMVDVNVHYQDAIRLAQRLIELRKENWELASYPVEGHSFTEPTSWADEYKRIYKLFEDNLKN